MPTPRTTRRGTTRTTVRKKDNTQAIVLAAVGGTALLIVVLVFAMGGDDGGSTSPGAGTATNAAAAPSPAGGDPAAGTPASAGAAEAPPAEPQKPAEPPLPSAAALRKQIKTAASAAAAAALARDADRLNDPKLSEECWTRVFELDESHEQARQKLDVRQLRPLEDLPGFVELAGSPQQLYLERFRDAAREELPRAGRAAIAKEWEGARKEIEARREKAKADPFWNKVDQLRLDLRGQPFFDELQYEMVDAFPPYALFVEVAGTPEEREARRKAVEDGYLPYLHAYDERLRSYLVPLAPKPPDPGLFLPVFVFLSEQRYHDYKTARLGSAGSPGVRAHYEPGRKQSFTWSTVIKPGLGAFEKGIQTLMHELTHAWVDQLASRDAGETRDIDALATHWFSEGIAEYMSFHFREIDKSIRFQPWRSNRLAETGRKAEFRIGLERALALPIHGLDPVAALLAAGLDGEARVAAMSTISSGFYADMSNFILWLNFPEPHGAGRAAQFEAYARAELAGEGGTAAFERCLPGLLAQGKELDAKVDDFVFKIASGKINPYKEMAAAGE